MQNNNLKTYAWSGPSNYNGVNPPKDHLIPIKEFERSIYSDLSGIGTSYNKDLISIKSREPYAAEFLKTKYGSMGLVLGTSLGTTPASSVSQTPVIRKK